MFKGLNKFSQNIRVINKNIFIDAISSTNLGFGQEQYPFIRKTNLYTCHLLSKNFFVRNKARTSVHSHLFKHSNRPFITYNDDDDMPFPNETEIYDEDDLIVDLNREKFKGLLVICPTPIGNLNDLSVRQYEALKNADILACEDTRRTSKLLHLIRDKKIKDKFNREFGMSFEDFVDKGGLSMDADKIKEEFIVKAREKSRSNASINNTTFSDFYDGLYDQEEKGDPATTSKSAETIKDRIQRISDSEDENPAEGTQNQNKNFKTLSEEEILKINLNKPEDSLKEEEKNERKKRKINKKLFKKEEQIAKKISPEEFQKLVDDIKANYSEKSVADSKGNNDGKNRKDSEGSKPSDPPNIEYYSFVKDRKDYYQRKDSIEKEEELFKEYMDPLAANYDDDLRLAHKMKRKAVFLLKISNRNKKGSSSNKTPKDIEDLNEDEIEEESLNYGLEEDTFGEFKKK